ncbi:MAG: Holliday junction resolvase RuvX [Burkholderiaceae bacterium]|jgi:putative Holliday junction resolvase|nr:Holliday junction resolvase RuvX [Burkholderiaceae bacterium]MEB2319578.1 Holliday junction resolvase RuvX [Pseudomonadota bacterium]
MSMGGAARTLLAFDFGRRFIGVAIGNTVTGDARPIERIAAEPVARRFERITALIDEWAPDALVVGLPLGRDGEEQPASVAARRFARQLEGRYRRPVVLADERYSSLAAQADGVSAAADDADAAAIILRQYLHEE